MKRDIYEYKYGLKRKAFWRSNWVIFLAIYLVGLGITLYYALFKQVILSDQMQEYKIYLSVIQTGHWQWVSDSIVNSCLTVTLLPAYMQRFTQIDAELVFKVWPCLLYPLMPAFVYLITRRYTNVRYAVLSSCLVLSSMYFLYYPAMGRVGIALAFLAGMVWGLLKRNYILSGLFAVAVVFSHYGTAAIAIILVLFVVVYMVARRRFNVDFRIAVSTLVILVSLFYVWHYVIVVESGRYVDNFALYSADSALTAVPDIRQDVSIVPDPTVNSANFYLLESRDPVVQVAFGKTLSIMNIPQKIEFVLSWLIVIILSLGLVYCVLRRKLTTPHAVIAVVAYSLILSAIVIPYISQAYGAVRTYFTSLVVLAPMFAIGIRDFSARFKLRGEWIGFGILLLYALCTSGVMHLMFGIVK